ncbi:MAG: dihydropyrimidinase [Anaerolineales bacterium]|nr:dihydropyrimidinase [Anaerolineales bacterium]
MTTTLIKNGTLITADQTLEADILLEEGKITLIGPDLAREGAKIVDAAGKYILPGGIDPHVHLDLAMFDTVSSDDHYTGHKAAAFGGTTTVMDFVEDKDPDLLKNVKALREKAAPKAVIDYSFHINITKFDDRVADQIPDLIQAGVTTLKVFTAYNNRLRLQDGEIFQLMLIAAEQGLLTMLHAENGDVIDILVDEALRAGHTEPIWHAYTRPAWGAVEAVLRGAALAAQADAPLYVVHMNTAGGIDQLAYAREQGLKVMGETCPQYLFFTEEHLKRTDGAKWICSPPMRTELDNKRIWQGLVDNTLQTVGTDHCPFFYDGKKAILYEGKEVLIPGKELGQEDFTKIPNGLPGVEDRMPVLWTEGVVKGHLTPNQFVAYTSTNAAKIFGLYPQKGSLSPGSDADIVIWDPEKKLKYGVEVAHQRTDYNLYEGWELQGYPEKVYLRGECIVDGDEWLGKRGQGQFLMRKPHAEVI